VAAPPEQAPGPGVDAAGQPVIDPTRNVLDLVAAAIQRQDDLRDAESRHLREMAGLREEYAAELRRTEAARLDAIRAVDVGAVQRAAEVQAQVANALASQVATSADAFRVALSAQLEPLQRDIADLRKTQYEQAGQKAQVVEGKSDQRSGTATIIAAASAALAFVSIVAAVVLAVTLRQ
jgi:hypothetical protein